MEFKIDNKNTTIEELEERIKNLLITIKICQDLIDELELEIFIKR